MIVYAELFLVLIKGPIYSNSKCRRFMQQINTIFDYVVQREKHYAIQYFLNNAGVRSITANYERNERRD